MEDESNLRGMEFRCLIVSTGGSYEDSGSASLDLCLWELCFFPSLPFIGVMLFPSFALGNVSGGGDTLLVPPFLFFFYSSFSSSPFFSFSFLSSFLPHLILHSSFSSAQTSSIFFFEGTACTVSFQDVTTDCN